MSTIILSLQSYDHGLFDCLAAFRVRRRGGFFRSYLDGGLVCRFDDLDELLGHEGCAADQTAVDVGLRQQIIGVLFVHGAAVEDGDGTCDLCAVELLKWFFPYSRI